MSETIRLRFSKLGRAKYISHLDLIRCLQRAICRANIPVAYSNGFHPHMQMSFASTLSLGFTSTGEILDLTVTEPLPPEEILARLNAALPQGIRMEEAGAPVSACRELAFADYLVEIPCTAPVALLASFDSLLAQPEILVEKKTKKGLRQVDIRPMLEVLEKSTTEECLVLKLRLTAGNRGGLNPTLVVQALLKGTEIQVEMPHYCRIGLLTSEKVKFF